ncbi:hypothetical protein DYB32_009700 [Aphanomyces invadans]|uniref:RRM domain-containing protein n=1 Tax=Aphanomyces invadans TaxID=157072 RepID=A0A418AJ90_9STRA|nr:hypothetical protein DYB32_009700 [Aphanomyces invadans]
MEALVRARGRETSPVARAAVKSTRRRARNTVVEKKNRAANTTTLDAKKCLRHRRRRAVAETMRRVAVIVATMTLDPISRATVIAGVVTEEAIEAATVDEGNEAGPGEAVAATMTTPAAEVVVPTTFVPGPIPKLNVNALGIVSTSVSDGPGKIFVGGLPYQLNEEQVKELLQAFGPLKSFHLVKELNSNLSKGYGFCEYLDPNITQIACAGLNDMQVGDKILTVRTALSAGGLYPPSFNPSTGASDNQPLAIPMAIVPSIPLGQPSRVLVLLNMVTTDDLTDPEEYQDICDDIRAECEKSGPIQDMIVPRPNEPQYQPSSVFVAFQELKAAETAANELHGRGFANQTVAVEFMDEDKFNRRDF